MAVIEMLRVRCPHNRHAEFMARDAVVWTPALARHDGFLSKATWLSLDDPDLITLVIRWESMEKWKSFPAELCERLDGEMGDLLLPMTCETYVEEGALTLSTGDDYAA